MLIQVTDKQKNLCNWTSNYFNQIKVTDSDLWGSFNNHSKDRNHDREQNRANLQSTGTTVQPTANNHNACWRQVTFSRTTQCVVSSYWLESKLHIFREALYVQSTAQVQIHGSWTEGGRVRGVHMILGNGREKGQGTWVLGLFRGERRFSVELQVYSVVGPECLLTGWCLVTVMVGMGELLARPLTEQRIWTQEDREAQGQLGRLCKNSKKKKQGVAKLVMLWTIYFSVESGKYFIVLCWLT